MATRQQQPRTTALDLMTASPVCAVLTDTVERVAQLMRSEDVGPVPVVDDLQNRRLLGIVTDRDLTLKVVAEGRDPRSTTVEAVMTRNPVTVHLEADHQRVFSLMAEHQVRRIPVVDDQGRLLGIIAQADIATRVEAPRQTAAVVEQISQPGGMMHGWGMSAIPFTSRRRRRGADGGARLIGSVALGAGLMYLLDPEQGSRRRSLLKDQVTSLLSRSEDAISRTSHDLGNRSRGLVAETGARLRGEEPDDAVLVERVRSAMGRVVSHPRAITVTAENGRVTLRGPILAREVEQLLAAVSAVHGVSGVENQLDVHAEAGDVPGLKGRAMGSG